MTAPILPMPEGFYFEPAAAGSAGFALPAKWQNNPQATNRRRIPGGPLIISVEWAGTEGFTVNVSNRITEAAALIRAVATMPAGGGKITFPVTVSDGGGLLHLSTSTVISSQTASRELKVGVTIYPVPLVSL